MQHRKNYKTEDITGQRFGRLVALSKVPGTRTQWFFQCDCGNVVPLKISRVYHRQVSCGCFKDEKAHEWVSSHITHGSSRTKLYRKYRSMMNRCYREDSWEYNRYGGRGITVCEEWQRSFETFQEWAYRTGYDPDLDGGTEQSIDRIDNDGPYSPENCRWSTAMEQQKNRECTTIHSYCGREYTASEFADKYGITDKSFVYRHIQKGQPLDEILREWELIHNVPEHLMELEDYASARGITSAYTRKLINAGAISGEKIGRKWYINKTELEKIK